MGRIRVKERLLDDKRFNRYDINEKREVTTYKLIEKVNELYSIFIDMEVKDNNKIISYSSTVAR